MTYLALAGLAPVAILFIAQIAQTLVEYFNPMEYQE